MPMNPAAIWVSNKPARDRAAGQLEDLEVLVGGVQDGDAGPVEDLGERVRSTGERVDQREAVAPRQLHERELREVGALAVELRVEGVRRGVAEVVDDLGESGLGD